MNELNWNNVQWTTELEEALTVRNSAGDAHPGFVIGQAGARLQLVTPGGVGTGELSGSMRRNIDLGTESFPTVGDYVVAEAVGAAGEERKYRVKGLLPRRNQLARRKPGKRPDEQVAAANVDLLAVVTTGGEDFSPRRIERFAENATGRDQPELLAIVNKCDLLEDPKRFVEEAQEQLPTISICGVSAETGYGMDGLTAQLSNSRTVVLAGSSGVGKTSIIRRLAGPDQDLTELRVRAVRQDEKGRHTTTARRIYALPRGLLMVDLPGVREVQVIGDPNAGGAFSDIDALAEECRFRDCAHDSEPGCAVKRAVERGEISPERYESYQALRREEALNQAERRRQRERKYHAIAQARRELKRGRER